MIVNVRDFGARGNGADDTAALIAAVRHINALGDATSALYFPKGTYSIDPRKGMQPNFGLLLTASHVEIYGTNATLQLLPAIHPYSQLLRGHP